jgi:hypothetical protein
MDTSFVVLVEVFFTFAIWSLLYKDNVFYRFATLTMVAATAGYTAAVSVNTIVTNGWSKIIGGDYLLLIPFVLGPLFLTRVSRKYDWLSRYPTGIVVGVGLGLSMSTYIKPQFTDQIHATIAPLFTATNTMTAFNNLVSFICVTSVLAYFIFTLPRITQSPPMKAIGQIGRYAMMSAFGATFGATIIGRITYLLGRLQFIMFQWLQMKGA